MPNGWEARDKRLVKTVKDDQYYFDKLLMVKTYIVVKGRPINVLRNGENIYCSKRRAKTPLRNPLLTRGRKYYSRRGGSIGRINQMEFCFSYLHRV